jgi:hypothetical protein
MELCSTIKTNLVSYWGDHIKVSARKDRCVITLPLTTSDHRRVSVIVERFGTGFIVHDGGKTTSELFCHGINVTMGRQNLRQEVAQKFRVDMSEGTFRKHCQLVGLEDAIFSVAQCTAMVMGELISHAPEVEEEVVGARVSKVLDLWKPSYIQSIEKNVSVEGRTASHLFQFVAFPASVSYRTVAVKIVANAHPKAQAERYGFLSLDLERVPMFNGWLRCAIIPHADRWPDGPLRLVRKLSDKTLELDAGREHEGLSLLPSIMSSLTSQFVV